jgi:hypothetical protein
VLLLNKCLFLLLFISFSTQSENSWIHPRILYPSRPVEQSHPILQSWQPMKSPWDKKTFGNTNSIKFSRYQVSVHVRPRMSSKQQVTRLIVRENFTDLSRRRSYNTTQSFSTTKPTFGYDPEPLLSTPDPYWDSKRSFSKKLPKTELFVNVLSPHLRHLFNPLQPPWFHYPNNIS